MRDDQAMSATLIVEVPATAEQQEQHDQDNQQGHATAIMRPAVVAGAVAIVSAAAKQQEQDYKQQDQVHQCTLVCEAFGARWDQPGPRRGGFMTT
jgi:hypothetical protein